MGVFWGDFRRREPDVHIQNTKELFDLYEEGKLKPLVSQVFPLEKYVDALNVFVERKAIGKICVKMKDE